MQSYSSTLMVDGESSSTLVSSGRSDKIVPCQEGKGSQIDRFSEKTTTSTEEAKTREKPIRKPGTVLFSCILLYYSRNHVLKSSKISRK